MSSKKDHIAEFGLLMHSISYIKVTYMRKRKLVEMNDEVDKQLPYDIYETERKFTIVIDTRVLKTNVSFQSPPGRIVRSISMEFSLVIQFLEKLESKIPVQH
ncbi:1219_t:CDS:2 [Funneliformis mosseae]|uniref:1219_t:CDS:1 n=1 Tax=Funneliformis mosseae TaxID=27381 RepID=A0A9N8YPS5_FUNMO|nr:1219_t:CDS:2 [Funneliformis mosseae]